MLVWQLPAGGLVVRSSTQAPAVRVMNCGETTQRAVFTLKTNRLNINTLNNQRTTNTLNTNTLNH